MKKIVMLLLLLLTITGCGRNTARNAIENYMKKYKTLDSEVLVDLENVVGRENLTNEQKETYRDILKKQYKDLTFDILEEEYDDEVSYVTLKIEVYDLYKTMSDSIVYLENNPQEFYDEKGEYDVSKFTDFRLGRMKNTTERVNYTITLTAIKEDNKYVVAQPTDSDIKKIHGIYNYEIS